MDVNFESSKQKLTSLNLLNASNIFCLTSSLCEPAHLFAACHWCVTNSCGSTWNLSRHCVRAALSREENTCTSPRAPHRNMIDPGNFVVSIILERLRIRRQTWTTQWTSKSNPAIHAANSSTYIRAAPKCKAQTSTRIEFHMVELQYASASNW